MLTNIIIIIIEIELHLFRFTTLTGIFLYEGCECIATQFNKSLYLGIPEHFLKHAPLPSCHEIQLSKTGRFSFVTQPHVLPAVPVCPPKYLMICDMAYLIIDLYPARHEQPKDESCRLRNPQWHSEGQIPDFSLDHQQGHSRNHKYPQLQGYWEDDSYS